MYKISFVLFMNIHGKRYSFYKLIYDYFAAGQDRIDHHTLLELGKMAGLSQRQTADEIIGCLYAPFLMKFSYAETEYHITDNARLKFADLLTEGKYQLTELGLLIRFEEKGDRLQMHLTDCLSSTFIDTLLQRGWSRNKSLYRLMKKAKEVNSTIKEVEFLFDNLPVFSENDTTFLDLINQYGRYWPQLKAYTGNLLFSGHYTSTLIPLHPNLFQELLEKCKQPIDWKGNPITEEAFAQLLLKHSINIDAHIFIKDCIRDGLLRYCSLSELSLTSSGYTLIGTYLKYSKEANYLNIVFRRSTEESYLLMLAENSLYPDLIQSYLNEAMTNNMRGWYTTVDSKDQVLQHLAHLKNLMKSSTIHV